MSWLPTEFDSKLRCPSHSTVLTWHIKLAHIHLEVCKNPKTSQGVVVWMAFPHSKHTPFNMWKLTTLEIVILLLPFYSIHTLIFEMCRIPTVSSGVWMSLLQSKHTSLTMWRKSHHCKNSSLDSISFQDEEDHIMRISFLLHLILLADTYFMNLSIMY